MSSAAAASATQHSGATAVTRRWMTLLAAHSPTFSTAAITHVPFVGAHDAGTAAVHHTSPLAADLPPSLRSVPGFLHPTLIRVVANWAKTQSVGLLAQLEAGVRYFDLRLSSHVSERVTEETKSGGKATQTKSEALWVSHGSISVPFSAALAEIRLFFTDGLLADNLEVIVIDLQHLTGFHPHHYQMLADDLARALGDLLIPCALAPGDGGVEIYSPLSNVWATNGRIFCLVPEHFLAFLRASGNPLLLRLFPRDDRTIRSDWKNTRQLQHLLRELASELRVRRRCPVAERKQLHVLQAVLTPTATDIVDALLQPRSKPSTVRQLATAANPAVLKLWSAPELWGLDCEPARSFFVFQGASADGAAAAAASSADPRNVLMLDFFEIGAVDSIAVDSRCNAVALCLAVALERFSVPPERARQLLAALAPDAYATTPALEEQPSSPVVVAAVGVPLQSASLNAISNDAESPRRGSLDDEIERVAVALAEGAAGAREQVE